MTIERTPEAIRGYDLVVSDAARHDLFSRGELYEPNRPCHARAAEFDGLCYLSHDHQGDHAYQPRLDLFG